MADTRQSPAPEATAEAGSPTSPPAERSSAGPSTDAGILPASHWQPIEEQENDADSAYSEKVNSTASITSSILRYRTLHGRTYHSDIGRAEAWEPNDEQHAESMDLQHHMCYLMLDNKLHLAPLDFKKVKKVIDVGTGTGIWAIDFGDEHPETEVIGIDVSPIQPTWVPPNVKFELDDANLDWTFDDNTFDFIHVRFMVGTISDWYKLYREAFRCCAPGGWIEHQDGSFVWRSDNGIPENSALEQFTKIFWEGGKKFGRTFRIVEDDLQVKGMEAAGFTDIQVKEIKVPLGEWPKDPRLKEVGYIAKECIEADVEGYMLYMCQSVLGWTREDCLVFCAHLRRDIRNPNLHPYFVRRIVYARKPEQTS
ncbi:hypothetical protein VTI74DRAFT_3429 [Chaetomium olivicolor]